VIESSSAQPGAGPRPSAWRLALAVASLAWSCGSGETTTPPAQKSPIQRLWLDPEARLSSPLDGVTPRPALWSEDFEHGLDGWRAMFDPATPLVDQPGMLVPAVEGEPGARYVSLGGKKGGLFRLMDVEPDHTYAVTCRRRTRDLVPVAGTQNFNGAKMMVSELTERGTAEQIFSGDYLAKFLFTHILRSVRGTTDWQEHTIILHTSKDTRSVLLGLTLGITEEVESGSVDFDDIQMREVEPMARWDALALEAVWERENMDHPAAGWQARRLVRGQLGGESRHSVLLLPGERLEFTVQLNDGRPELTLGVGPWVGALEEGAGSRSRARILLDGDELAAREIVQPARSVDGRWSDLALDLSRKAGREVEIALEVQGDCPVVFGAPSVAVPATDQGLNLVLVSIDTLRADHVGAYGYPEGTTPNLDALARRGMLVRDVTTQEPNTLPSHATMLTGQFPAVHGTRPGRTLTPRRSPLLAEMLASRGYRTQAFTAGGYLNTNFGFLRGFDGYANLDSFRHPESRFVAKIIQKKPDKFSRELFEEYGPDRIERWIEGHADERFFLFLHTYTVHDFDAPDSTLECRARGCTSQIIDPLPYLTPTYLAEHGISDVDMAHMVHLYDAALRHVDAALGRIFAKIDALGLGERTVIAVTSDHGVELLERGTIIHGTTLYEEMVSVPWILRIPGETPREITQPAMLIDVAPTLLAALGVPADPRMQGRDVLHDTSPRAVWTEVGVLAHKYSLRHPDGWKIIHGPPDSDPRFPNPVPWELYKLPDDAGEKVNRVADDPERAASMERELEEIRGAQAKLGASLGSVGDMELDDETTAMLKQLGYL